MDAMIDTLATYEAIAAAGIDDRGARAISKAIAKSTAMHLEDLATKVDLARLEAKIEANLDNKTGELLELIATSQNRTIVWMFGMLVTFSGIIIGVIKLT